MLVYKCKQCGAELLKIWSASSKKHKVYTMVYEWYGGDLVVGYFGVPRPEDVRRRFSGVCPNCGRNLNEKPTNEDVVIASRRP